MGYRESAAPKEPTTLRLPYGSRCPFCGNRGVRGIITRSERNGAIAARCADCGGHWTERAHKDSRPWRPAFYASLLALWTGLSIALGYWIAQ